MLQQLDSVSYVMMGGLQMKNYLKVGAIEMSECCFLAIASPYCFAIGEGSRLQSSWPELIN